MMKKVSALAFVLAILIATLLIGCLTTSQQEVSADNTTEKTTGKAPKSTATVQVLIPATENLFGTEAAWLPGQIQDRLKSNMQEYLGLRTVVDSNAEKSLKQLQAESESGARDENTAIELGKITTAKYGLFSKIRKTGSGYSISVDYTDLTTGVQVASATSKEYSRAEYLYGSTGAVDEVTLALANKLNIQLNDLTKNLLASGSADFSVDAQLALAKQNEEQYQKLMKQYDDELKRLSVSNDLSAIENKKKIEAEKALLAEKQKAEQKRVEELAAQKQQAESDAKLEAERSIELKTQRDNLAAQATAKATEVRKLKLDKQGVLGQITVIESKKKAVLDIRQSIEQRCNELLSLMREDKKKEVDKIRSIPWSTVELENGLPTIAAMQRREKMIENSNKDKENKFITDCTNVRIAVGNQETSLLAEISSDLGKLAVPRKVNSLGEELKVSYGPYSGAQAGWNTFLSLYSDGINIFNGTCVIKYDAITGKKAPDIASADSTTMAEYVANTDMYNSLLTRGDQILYYELDYTVRADDDNSPSQYVFSFNTLHVFNMVTGKEVQTIKIGNNSIKTMTPVLDLRKKVDLNWARRKIYEDNELQSIIKQLKGEKYIIYNPKLYRYVMDNGYDIGSFFDAIYFCNKLSIIQGLEPVYSVERITDYSQWNYTPNTFGILSGKIRDNKKANGYRLPTYDECYSKECFGDWSYRTGSDKWFYSLDINDCYAIEKKVVYDFWNSTIDSDEYKTKYLFQKHSADKANSMLPFDLVRNKID